MALMMDIKAVGDSSAAREPRALDLALVASVLALVGLSVVMIYSASVYVAEVDLKDSAFFLKRQVFNVGMALAALGVGVFLPYRRLRHFVYPLLVLSLVLLFVVLLPGVGTTVGKSTRWFRFLGVSFQPTELAKLVFVMYLAYSLEKKVAKIKSFSVGFLPHIILAAVLMGLSLAQPDLGTAIVLGAVMVIMLFVAGTRVAYITGLAMLAVPALVWLISRSSMRMARMLAFLDPWEHRYDTGFQIANALAALGSGGAFGLGLGASRQKIGYMPEAQTDFILPIIGEELGFVGVAAIVLLMAVVIWRGAAIAWKARDDFGRHLAFGITALVAIQAVVNMGVATALLPTKGLTLPFVSYGGTSLMALCFGVGVLLNIGRDAELPGEAPPVIRRPKTKVQGTKAPIVQRERPVTQVMS